MDLIAPLIAPLLWLADQARGWRHVRVLVHRAIFLPEPPEYYFIKVVNLVKPRDRPRRSPSPAPVPCQIASVCFMAGRFEAAIGYVEEVAVAIRDGRDEVPFGLGGLGRATITAGSSR